MNFKVLLPLAAIAAVSLPITVEATEMSVTLNAISKKMILTPKSGGDPVTIGEPSAASSPIYKFTCDPGEYVVDLFDANDVAAGSMVLTVEGESQSERIYIVSLYSANKDNGVEWELGRDYDVPFDRIKVSAQKGEVRSVTPVVYQNSTRKVVSVPVLSGDTYQAYFVPMDERAEDFAEGSVSGTVTMNRSVACTLAAYTEFTFTAPKDAEVTVAQKPGSTHYVPFIKFDPMSAVESGDDMVYSYRIPAGTYNYRVSKPGCITNAAIFTTDQAPIVVTEAQLTAHKSDYYNHDVTVNNGYNYADVYLNINPQNHLMLRQGEQFHIVNLRTWQLANSTTANYFLEPDFHYTVLNTDFEPDNSVVEVSEDGVLTARKEGSAIVQVRYDAMAMSASGGDLWSSIWAENVGTFVVTVGENSTSIKSNMKLPYVQDNRTGEIDAEHDIFYYLEGEDGFNYTFTPEGVASVTVASPLVDITANTLTYPDGFSEKNVTANADGSYTVKLKYGRNIVRLTDAAGKSLYQVVSAKPCSYTVEQRVREDDYLLPGDKVYVNFSGLFHNAGKLAAIYNQGCSPKYLSLPEGYTDKTVKGAGGQYNFPVLQYLTVDLNTDQAPATLAFGDGCLTFGGFGDKLGGHRDIDYYTGRNPNFTAVAQNQLSGVIPPVSFKTAELKDGLNLSLKLEVKKSAVPVALAAAKVVLGDDLKITSSDSGVATVDATGKVTAVGDGTAVITYSNADGSKKFTCEVTVWSIKLEKIYFENDEVEAWASMNGYSYVEMGLRFVPENASVKDVVWEVSDPSVCEVKNNQIYTIKGAAGESDVKVTSADGRLSATCHLVLHMKVASMKFENKTLEMTEGESITFTPIYTPENAYNKNAVWTSSNPDVATVDENGFVCAIKEGTAVITATWVNSTYVKANCTVTVKTKDQSGIESVVAPEIKVGPNPFTDRITVTVPEASVVEIYTLQGSRVIAVEIEAGSRDIDTSALAPGLYLVRVGSETVKMIRR